MVTFARAERAALSELLRQVGPDAPTLCEGWTAADLAAHLVARERRPDSGPGLIMRSMRGWTERVRGNLRQRPFSELVHLIATGPPKSSPLGLIPGLDTLVNGPEFFVHHEDVRRAQPGWEPRGDASQGSPTVTLSGKPSELLLYAFGRGANAVVEVDGDDAAVARLHATRFGV
jgi:uncharacterized protein (TIGR03085 family)